MLNTISSFKSKVNNTQNNKKAALNNSVNTTAINDQISVNTTKIQIIKNVYRQSKVLNFGRKIIRNLNENMPQFRQDPVTGGWVIIAAARGKRPISGNLADLTTRENYNKNCDFCLGNEDETPPEVFAIRNSSEPTKWEARAFQNKYSALGQNASFAIINDGFYKTSYASGVSEVIADTTNHSKFPYAMTVQEMRNTLQSYKERYLELATNSTPEYLSNAFKNIKGDTVGDIDNLSIQYIHIFRNNGKRQDAL